MAGQVITAERVSSELLFGWPNRVEKKSKIQKFKTFLKIFNLLEFLQKLQNSQKSKFLAKKAIFSGICGSSPVQFVSSAFDPVPADWHSVSGRMQDLMWTNSGVSPVGRLRAVAIGYFLKCCVLVLHYFVYSFCNIFSVVFFVLSCGCLWWVELRKLVKKIYPVGLESGHSCVYLTIVCSSQLQFFNSVHKLIFSQYWNRKFNTIISVHLWLTDQGHDVKWDNERRWWL